jgi:hypothetical protein
LGEINDGYDPDLDDLVWFGNRGHHCAYFYGSAAHAQEFEVTIII